MLHGIFAHVAPPMTLLVRTCCAPTSDPITQKLGNVTLGIDDLLVQLLLPNISHGTF